MALGALAMGFSIEDLRWMSLADFAIFAAIRSEAESDAEGGAEHDDYRDATQADIEKLKRM